ncbi:MAG: hypothetical protein ACI9H6_000358 [Patiriisocius sp.]|jgi:hypothetical protein
MAKKTENTPTPVDGAWNDYVKPFAEALGVDVATATETLKGVAGAAGDRAMSILKDVTMSPDVDIKAALPEGTPSGVANQAIALLREAVPVADASTMMFGAGVDLLPSVPDDGPWVESLKAGGRLLPDEPTVISGVRAAVADRVGLFDLPAKVVSAMEAHVDTTREQLDPRFFALSKQLTRRSYAEIFSAIDGLDGSFVTERRKKQFLERLNAHMWPAINGFHSQLKGWVESMNQGASNPALLMQGIASMIQGGGAPLMSGLMAPPDAGGLRDAAEGVNDDINRIFAGTGVVVARALAFDANQIKNTMNDAALPGLIGAANRDQMLRQLGVDVSSNYSRMETNLTKYVMGILNVKNVAGGNEEIAYFSSLYMLGCQIPWDQIGRMPNVSGGTGRREAAE